MLHHINFDCLYAAFFNLKKTAAVGVDEVTWHEYEQDVEANIVDLHERIHQGTYRAKPSLRIHILKPDGRLRPLGIASLEDKIVQKAVVWVLQSIYEQDFVGFSYGFRPSRSQHNALDALTVAITGKKVNWILDADIEGLSIPPERWSCRRTCFRQSSGSSHPPLPAALTRSTTSG